MKKLFITKLMAILLIGITIFISLGGMSHVYAASGHAYCAGYVGDIDCSKMVRNAYNTYRAMGYSSNYTLSPAYETLASGRFSDGTRYLESKVILLAGYGSHPDGRTLWLSSSDAGIKTNNTEGRLVGINTINFSNAKLITLAGCYTSAQNDSLAVEIYRKGAGNVVGFKQAVGVNSMQQWLDRYNDALKSGKSVWNALVYAGQIDYNDNSVKDVGFFGSSTSTINSIDVPVTMSKDTILEDSNTENVFEDIAFTKENQDIEAISKYIASKYPNFENETYEIKIHEINAEQNLYMIDYVRSINEFSTSLGYVVTVEHGKVKSITNNNKEVEIQKEELLTKEDILEKDIEGYKQNVVNSLNKKYRTFTTINVEDVDVISQRTRLYLDTDTNKQYCKIFTTYKNTNGLIEVDETSIEL